MDFLDIKEETFFKLCDKFRSPHLWVKDSSGKWILRHNVNKTGFND